MKNGRALFVYAGLITCLVLSSCATTTTLTAVWKDNTYDGGYLTNVMVVGIFKNTAKRRLFEDEFVRKFESHGVEAMSSAAIIPSVKELDKDTIRAEVRNRGVDTIFVTHLLGIEKKEIYHPPVPYAVPYGHYGHFYRYYPFVCGYVLEPGYYSRHRLVKLESNLYEAASGRLVWSVASETMDPESVQQTIESLSNLIMNNLREQGLLE